MNIKSYLKKRGPLKAHSPSMGFVGVIFIAMVTSLIFKSFKVPRSADATVEHFEASTFIPSGHVLIPIDVENAEALNAMSGGYAWVDLYTPTQSEFNPIKPVKIVKKIRILRAPLDPNHYGIIVPEEYADAILSYGFLFRVTLNNKDHHNSELLVGQKPKRPTIVFGD